MDFLQELLKPEIIWFVIGLILLLAELAAPGLIIGFGGVGAWIVMLVCLFVPISISVQLLIFIISSVLLLLLLRRSLKKIFKMETIDNQIEEDEFIGQHAVVTKKISPDAPGKVEFKGAAWEAEADCAIEKGKTVEITDRKSIKFIVKPT